LDSTRKNITRLIEQGCVPKNNIDSALQVVEFYPDTSDWRLFIDRALLFLGALGVSLSLLLFIAYNWTELGRFSKFALVQAFMVAAIFVAVKFSNNKAIFQAATLAAVIALGVLLALFGQTYQTGADPWQLFAVWAVLMLPWALIAQSASIWLVWIVLLNTALFLYLQISPWFFWGGTVSPFWWLLGLNSIIWFAWELLSLRFKFLSKRWAVWLLALVCGAIITWQVMLVIFKTWETNHSIIVFAVWLLWLCVLYVVYRRLRPDLFVLTIGCLSIVVVLTTGAARWLFEAGAAGWLILAVVVIALGVAAANWLRVVHKDISQ